MTNPAMPSTAREADARPVSPSPEPVLGRAEDVLPRGYTPALPASERAAQHLAEAREVLALTRVAADAGASPDVVRFLLGQLGGQLRNAATLLRAGAAVLALALVATLAPVGGTPAAQAATVAAVPALEAPEPDPAPVKDRTRFLAGTWLDLGNGDLAVRAPLTELVPSLGWLPSPFSLVQVFEFSTKRGRWVLRKTLTTNSRGIAGGIVHLGGGIHTVRVVHPGSPWTLPTTGSTRRVDVSDEPLDIV